MAGCFCLWGCFCMTFKVLGSLSTFLGVVYLYLQNSVFFLVNYLQNLSIGEWATLVPFTVAVLGLIYLSLQGLANSSFVGPAIKEKLSMLPGMKTIKGCETVKMDCAKSCKKEQ